MNVPWINHTVQTRKSTIKKVWNCYGLYKLLHDPLIISILIEYNLFSGKSRKELWNAAEIRACSLDWYGEGRDGPVQVEQEVFRDCNTRKILLNLFFNRCTFKLLLTFYYSS